MVCDVNCIGFFCVFYYYVDIGKIQCVKIIFFSKWNFFVFNEQIVVNNFYGVWVRVENIVVFEEIGVSFQWCDIVDIGYFDFVFVFRVQNLM